MIAETDYKCLMIGCQGVLFEYHASASAHWLECDCCGKTWSFYAYFTELEEQQK